MDIPSYWGSIGDILWWFLSLFILVAYLMALFSVITDLFRDRNLHGVAKAVWLLFLLFLPILTALVYLIVRGKGMGERAQARAAQGRTATEDYIRSVADSGGPATEIAQAKSLLDSGAITQQEYESLKSAALRATA